MNSIKRYLKLKIKKFLKKKGYIICPVDDYLIKLENVNYKWLQKIKPGIIIDVGASNGGFAKKIRKILPQAQMFCFEPLQQSYNSLIENFNDDKFFEAFNIAVSNMRGNQIFMSVYPVEVVQFLKWRRYIKKHTQKQQTTIK